MNVSWMSSKYIKTYFFIVPETNDDDDARSDQIYGKRNQSVQINIKQLLNDIAHNVETATESGWYSWIYGILEANYAGI